MFPWKLQSPPEDARASDAATNSESTGQLSSAGSLELSCPVLKVAYETSGSLLPHRLPCGHVISDCALSRILKEPLAVDRQCPHDGCCVSLYSCSIADYPEDRDTLAIVSHNSFSFSGSSNTHVRQASSSLTSAGSEPVELPLPSSSAANATRGPHSGSRAVQSHADTAAAPSAGPIDLQLRPSDVLAASLTPSQPTYVPGPSVCRPVQPTTTGRGEALSSGSTSRHVSGSPLRQEARVSGGRTTTQSSGRQRLPSGASGSDLGSTHSHSGSLARVGCQNQSGPISAGASSRSSVPQERSFRRSISMDTDPSAKPAKPGGRQRGNILLQQMSAMVVTVVDCNKEKLKILLHNGMNVTVDDVKKQVEMQMGNPVAQQRLLYKGLVLTNAHKLSSYGIEQKAQLHLDGAAFRFAC